MSPYPDGGDPNDPVAVTQCNGEPQTGRLYRNSEAEPHLEVNPANPLNMIATWHQDRWSNGSGQGIGAAYTFDGGATWTPTNIPFTRCAGGSGMFEGDRARASDPWVAFSAHGTAAYVMALVTRGNRSNAQVVARSLDGGATWAEITSLRDDPGKGRRAPFNDKNTMTGDPVDDDTAYAIWTVFKGGMGTTRFARTRHGGERWEPAREIYRLRGDFNPNGRYPYPQGNQLKVLPDGTLLNVFVHFRFRGRPDTWGFSAIRSLDSGKHWDRTSTDIAPVVLRARAIDFEKGLGVRDGGIVPDIAVGPSGAVYVVYQSGEFDRPDGTTAACCWNSGVAITMSADGGDTWSVPTNVNGRGSVPLSVQSFLPEVTVRSDGTVAVLYYDFRYDVPGDSTLDTDVHVAFFDPNLNFLGEKTITSSSFDMRQAPIARGYFPGDYVGFTNDGTDFLAAFTMTNNLGLPVELPPPGLTVDTHNRQDVWFARVSWP